MESLVILDGASGELSRVNGTMIDREESYVEGGEFTNTLYYTVTVTDSAGNNDTKDVSTFFKTISVRYITYSLVEN
jgi:hypothetical protein